MSNDYFNFLRDFFCRGQRCQLYDSNFAGDMLRYFRRGKHAKIVAQFHRPRLTPQFSVTSQTAN